MRKTFSLLFFGAILMVGSPTAAEVVWTCTQPSAVDNRSIDLRYNIASPDEIVDEFGLRWRIVRNDDVLIVATFAWPLPSQASTVKSARTLIIDPSNGNAILAIIDLNAQEASKLVRGICRKS